MKGSFTKEVIFLEDSKIVQLYWDRDQSAIPATSEKYGSYCTSIARNILGSHEDAEECVNDTYLKAWNSMPPHKPSFLSKFLFCSLYSQLSAAVSENVMTLCSLLL